MRKEQKVLLPGKSQIDKITIYWVPRFWKKWTNSCIYWLQSDKIVISC